MLNKIFNNMSNILQFETEIKKDCGNEEPIEGGNNMLR